MGALTLNSLAPGADVATRAATFALNRLAYGPRPGEVRQVLAGGLERWIEDQLEAAPDPDLETRLRALPTLGYPISQVLALYEADNRSIGRILDEFYTAKLVRAVHARNQLEEVMVDFWFNHFNVYILDGFARYSTAAYERDAIRPHALGRFRSLLGATAAHPAMLFFLDNYLSTGPRVVGGRLISGLNENYGRELLELHTVGVDAGYTEADVIAAARAFTGWTIDNLRSSGNFVFRAQNHDRDAKSVFGLNLPAGGAQDDGEKVLDHLAAHPLTARFISTKLARRFVADDPPRSLVDKMAREFLASDGDIRAVLRAMVGSAEFWSASFDGSSKAKTPLEFVVSAVRAVNGEVGSGTRGLGAALANMGMPLYQCFPPTGYSSLGTDWLDPSGHLYRVNFAFDLAAGAVAGVAADPRALASGADLGSAGSIARTVDAQLFAGRLSASTRGAVSALDGRSSVSLAARALGLLLASPEFQVR